MPLSTTEYHCVRTYVPRSKPGPIERNRTGAGAGAGCIVHRERRTSAAGGAHGLPRQVVLNKIGKALPELIGGSADLAASNLTNLKVRPTARGVGQ